jgi:all-trans-8'-apo-beta-carotenal 15,15'-oxygenase
MKQSLQRRQFLKQTAVASLATGAGWALADTPAMPESASVADFNRRIAGQPMMAPFAGVQGDLQTERLATSGRWPEALRGRFLRNGPALMQRGGQRVGHWFEGDGMVQRFAIDGGRISHLGRLVRTKKLAAEEAAGKWQYPSFSGRVAPGVPVTGPDSFNVANTNAIEHGGRILALWEGGSAHSLELQSLATQGPVTWQPGWEQMPFSAHPKLDAQGVLWNFGTFNGRLMLYRIGANGRLQDAQLAKLPFPAGMVHDAAITERFFVIPLPPLRWLPGQPVQLAKGEPLRLLVVAKDDANKQQVFELPPGMVFHVGNAFERGRDMIEMSYVASRGNDFLQDEAYALMQGHARNSGLPSQTTLVRLNLATGKAEHQALGDAVEFPRVHPAYIGAEARYLVTVASWETRAGQPLPHGLQVRDLQSGRVQRFDHGPLGVAEEAVVVPKPGRSREEDAWLLATVFDGRRGVTSVQLFEMMALADGPIARADLPYALPYGFHGNFQAA